MVRFLEIQGPNCREILSLPKQSDTWFFKQDKKTRRRKRTCTRETKSFQFPLCRQQWTGSCWPVFDEFRFVWDCVCVTLFYQTDIEESLQNERVGSFSHFLLSRHQFNVGPDPYRKVCLFVCLFVVIQPKNPYFAFRSGLEVKPLGVYPLGPRTSKRIV